VNNQQKKDLQALILRLNELYPGDTDAVMERLMAILSYCITRKLVDPETLATMRTQQWPENIQKLLAAPEVTR
jgi:hypothetical protein